MENHVFLSAAIEPDKHNSRDSYQILLSDKDQQEIIVMHARGEVCYLQLSRLTVWLLSSRAYITYRNAAKGG